MSQPPVLSPTSPYSVAIRAGMSAALALVFTLLTSTCSALEQVTHPFQGVTLIHRTETSPRKLDIWVALIDTLAPGIRFQATQESPYAPDTVIAQTTRSFMTQTGAQLAINGDFYSSAGTFNGLVHRNPSGFAASSGNIFSNFDSSRPAFHIGKNNVAHTVTGSGTSPNPSVPVWNAVGGSDYLINNGALPTYWNDPNHGRYTFANELHPRTAIGVNADRTKVAFFVVDGRQTHSGGMKFPEMADMLRNDYGMHWAINLDGGGSTTMAIDDTSPRTLNKPSDGADRSVANSLALFARPTPTPVPANAKLLAYQQQSDGYQHAVSQINSSQPTTNYGFNSAFRVGYDTTTFKSRGVLSFDLSGIPFNATIHSVSLTLDAFSATGATGQRYVDLEVYELNDTIDEGDVTWNRSTEGNNWSTPGGDIGAMPLSSLVAQQTTGLKTFVSTVDFVTAAQHALLSGQPLGLLVAAINAETLGASTSSNLNLRFRSDDSTVGQRPTLNVQYSFTPVPGDFNEDGIVDATDYVVWRKGPSSIYTETKYQQWQANFGKSLLVDGSSFAVPEPGAFVTFAVWIAFAGLRLRRGRR